MLALTIVVVGAKDARRGPAATGRRWRGQTPEERTAERREQLLEAGLEVFGTAGFRHAKVRDVCREAKLTERYFYESFRDKEALLEAVGQTAVEGLVAAIAPGVALLRDDLDAAIAAGAGGIVGYLTDDPRRARILLVEIVGVSPELDRRRRAWVGALVDTFAAAVERVVDGWPGDRPVEVDVAGRAVLGSVQELLMAFVDGELAIDRAGLVVAITTLLAQTRDALVRAPNLTPFAIPAPERTSE